MSGLDQAGDIVGQNLNSRTLAPRAVAFQVLVMLTISFVTITVFNVLRPKNKLVYEPKVKYHIGSKPPPRISDSIFGWFPPLIRTHEPELLDKVGLDAVAFLRFLRMLRWLFTAIALLVCGVLIPINVVYNVRHVPNVKRDVLSMLTIRDVQGHSLFFHVGATYAITLIVCIFVHVHWKQMVQLRYRWFRSPEYMQSFYARTLAITHVPKKYQSDEGLNAIFSGLNIPYPTTSVHIGRSVGQMAELVEYHNTTVRELERILVRYLRGGKIASRRPKIRLGAFLGIFGGVTKDAIDFYTAKLQRTEEAIMQYRTKFDTRKPENYGFASMAAVPYAHIVARLLEGKRPKGTKIELAPNPKDIIWDNMNKSDAEILSKKIIGFLWLALVCFINTVPLAVISVLANIASLTYTVPFLRKWSEASPSTFAFASGVLPPAVQALFGWVLPIIMRWLTKYQGALTHSRLDRAVVARYYMFLVLSQLVIFTLLGVIFNSVKEIVREIGRDSFSQIIANLGRLSRVITRTYVDQASFWLAYFPLRGFLAIFDLAQILNLFWISFKTRLFGRTPRDIRDWTQPPNFEYAIYYSNLLFMAAVALVFAPLAPLVAVAGAIIFWLSSFVYKYQLMFVFVSRVETGGRMWNVVINRLLFSVVLMQLLMLLTIGFQYRFRSLIWLSTVPPILIVIAFKLYINRHFDRVFRYYVPSEEEVRQAKVHSERADNTGHRLEKRFGHPALIADLFTPMLHAKMMPLLGEVYKGKIGDSTQTKLDEYGGQTLDAQIVEGGIKIAAVDQRDLEYDPALYQRDRGELDWDQRTHVLSESISTQGVRASAYFDASLVGRSSPVLPGYDRYMALGPGATHHTQPSTEFEMASLNSTADQQRPLMYNLQATASTSSYFELQPQQGQPPLPPGLTPPHGYTQSPPSSYPGSPEQRPYTPQQHGRQLSGYSAYNEAPPRPPSQQQVLMHGRQTSGFSAYNEAASPPLSRPPSQQQLRQGQMHGRQTSGFNPYTDIPPPHPPHLLAQPQPVQMHGRQMSGYNPYNGTTTPPSRPPSQPTGYPPNYPGSASSWSTAPGARGPR